MLKKPHKEYKPIKINKPLVIFLIVCIVIWEWCAKSTIPGNRWKMIFPPLEDIFKALTVGFMKGYAGNSFWIYVANSLQLLGTGLFIGVIFALLFSSISIISKTFRTIYLFIVNVFDLLPGVAILPIAILALGVSRGVIIFMVVHSVIWPMSHNILDGFFSVPLMYIESAQNMEMKNFQLLFHVYIPASLQFIISGLKIGWARAWRGLISAEMIFGIASSPGIGMYLNIMRTNLKNADIYACLLVIIVIGIVIQYGILVPLENMTVKKWGM